MQSMDEKVRLGLRLLGGRIAFYAPGVVAPRRWGG